jgi:predicted component of viral defense system (DUF524 family)
VLTGERLSAFGVPMWRYAAVFGDQGALVYNDTVTSYSDNSLRPDYWWKPADGRPGVALDAKFRLSHQPSSKAPASDEEVTTQDGDTTSGALLGMHAYRDALPNVRAAVVLYPGITTEFWDTNGHRHVLALDSLLSESWEGVGEIAMTPVGINAKELG